MRHPGIEEHRDKIDAIDEKLLKLLSDRAKHVIEIGKLKEKSHSNFHIPEREKKIFEKLKLLNKGPFSETAIEKIFREILSASLALESPLKIAFLGPEGTFTHQAAIRRFGLSAHFVPQKSILHVFQEVCAKRANYGMAPIENSTEGVVSHTLDLFVEYPLKICGEVKLPIVHHLLAKSDDLQKIQKVYSHPQALAQCRNWLEKNLPHARTIESPSTSQAAEALSHEENAAAIASEYAAEMYGLKILASHLQDHPNNFTRFVVVGDQECGRSGKDKTSLMVSAKDEPGVLYKLLTPLARAKINLTAIESRPLKGQAWEYIFFIDLEGHQQEIKVKKALAEMEKYSTFLKVLGSYPREE